MEEKRQGTVLVVDDNSNIVDFIQRNLDARGFKTLTARDGIEALQKFNAEQVDLVILDLLMPKMDGLEVIRRIRAKSITPIIVLSALGEENTKIQALDLGADDYLTKPFGVGELLARVKAVLRRARYAQEEHSPAQTAVLTYGPVTLHRERHEVFVNGKEVELTPTEFSLLEFLMANEGKVLTHREILQHVWGPEYGQESEYLRVYIGRLRQKIEKDPNNPKLLHTERGIGYSFRVKDTKEH